MEGKSERGGRDWERKDGSDRERGREEEARVNKRESTENRKEGCK